MVTSRKPSMLAGFAVAVASLFLACQGEVSSEPEQRVAVLTTGNLRSFAFFRDEVMPRYHANFWKPGYDLFLSVGDKETLSM